MENRFRLLVGSRVAAPRQQTPWATVQWSYGLLSPMEGDLSHVQVEHFVDGMLGGREGLVFH